MTNPELIKELFAVVKKAEESGMTMTEILGAVCTFKTVYELEFTVTLMTSMKNEKKPE